MKAKTAILIRRKAMTAKQIASFTHIGKTMVAVRISRKHLPNRKVAFWAIQKVVQLDFLTVAI
jgi:hypothetical protein